MQVFAKIAGHLGIDLDHLVQQSHHIHQRKAFATGAGVDLRDPQKLREGSASGVNFVQRHRKLMFDRAMARGCLTSVPMGQFRAIA